MNETNLELSRCSATESRYDGHGILFNGLTAQSACCESGKRCTCISNINKKNGIDYKQTEIVR